MAWSGGAGQDSATRGWEQQLIARLAGTIIDAAILVAPSVTSVPIDNFPMVAIDPHQGPGVLPSVRADDRGGARLAIEHLVDLRHRRIGYLGGRSDLASARERERGFREAMRARQLPVDESIVVSGDYSRPGAVGPAYALLTASPRPTAIFAANDLSALTVLEVAHELGVSVPGELSVVGFDDIPESLRSDPALSTVAQSIVETGQRAATMLLQLMAHSDPAERHVRMATRMVLRDSTAPPPSAL